ncbi:hypothetical protein QFZ23_004317 [Arthrobacter globiformis]|uniref:AbiTii domain-containing protein n=1 Tax=Arthrobacter globiformis TaxID=1665 RepID=UPI00278807E9|nr:hypothetical protein [Arthrobacter globiformis]MDQ1060416.1 hypothetical protein [Arthrobacter globiformis]
MNTRSDDILSQIERDLLSDRALATVLRKLILLGGKSGSSELQDWASRELRGYDNDENLPSYRLLPAPIQIDGVVSNGMVKHQTISLSRFPDFVREDLQERVPIRAGVGEIQALIDSNQEERTVHLQVPGAMVLAEMIDHGNPSQRTTAVYWAVSVTALEGLLDQIKTRLAELIAELRSVTSPLQALPTASQATHAVNFIVRGIGSRVNITQASGGSKIEMGQPTKERPEPRFWTLGKRISAIAVGAATIGAFVISWWQYQAGA